MNKVRKNINQNSFILGEIQKYGFYHDKLKKVFSFIPKNSEEICYFSYIEINPHESISKRNNIYCIKINDHNSYLNDLEKVALFPEEFIHKVKEDSPVFYFCNRFIQRYLIHTEPNLSKFNTRTGLNILPVKTLTAEVVANWVHLHERFHRTGNLPIPKNLYEKLNSINGGVEELRADLQTLIHLESFRSINSLESTYNLILAERLVYFPLRRKMNSFDTYSSYLLLNELLNLPRPIDSLLAFKLLLKKIENNEITVSKLTCQKIRKKELSRLNKLMLNQKIPSFYNSIFNQGRYD